MDSKGKYIMGYVIGYQRKDLIHDKDTWDAFLKDAIKVSRRFKLCIQQSIQFIKDEVIIGDIDIKIGDELGDGLPPYFCEDKISFNGVGEEARQMFTLSRDETFKITDFEEYREYYKVMWEESRYITGSVKTQRMPYSTLAVVILSLYKYHFKDRVEVYCEDEEVGFLIGVRIVNETLGYNLDPKEIHYK